MKKLLLNKLFCFIIGAIIFSAVGVYATAGILAKNVLYTSKNSDFTASNVKDALDTLYDYATTSAYDGLSFEKNRVVSFGNRMATRTATLTLDAGSYVLYSTVINSTVRASETLSEKEVFPNLTYTTGTCSEIDGNQIVSTGSTAHDTIAGYVSFGFTSGIWKCKFTESSDVTTTVTYSNGGSDVPSQIIKLYSVKLD